MTELERRQHGLWDSPITAASLSGNLRLSDVHWAGDGHTVVWLEGRSDRGVLVAGTPDAAPLDLTREQNVRASVGYGGGDFTTHDDWVLFVSHPDGRLHRRALIGGDAVPITPAFGHAASPAISPDGRWVAYVHHDDDNVDRIAVVDAHGRHWPRILAEGHDFYMQPTWSPDGRALAWVAWDHPNMPWDGTTLYVAPVVASGGELPRADDARAVAGGDDVAVAQPTFVNDGGRLLYVSDESGWGHVWSCDLSTGERRQVTSGDFEHGGPAWAQGMRTYAADRDGEAIFVVRGHRGFRVLHRVELATGETVPVGALAAYTDVDQLEVSPVSGRLALVATAPAIPPRVLVYDPSDERVRVMARSSTEAVPAEALATPAAMTWTTAGDEIAHGLFYPPTSTRFQGVGAPPVVVLVHGGPTGQARAGWDPSAQFLATRGYAVLQLNYRGSSGFGRAFMHRLRGDWGVCDVEDAASAVAHLGETGLADATKAVIMGGSAGGFTVLQTMVERPHVFAAGVCLYGVANQFHLARETHKFEARYLDRMLGPLPDAADVYRARSPVYHADRIRRPLAVFQGEIDRVVPRAQSDAIVAALRRSGTPHVYHVYEGEGHGWRKTETIAHFWNEVDAFLREHVVFAST